MSGGRFGTCKSRVYLSPLVIIITIGNTGSKKNARRCTTLRRAYLKKPNENEVQMYRNSSENLKQNPEKKYGGNNETGGYSKVG